PAGPRWSARRICASPPARIATRRSTTPPISERRGVNRCRISAHRHLSRFEFVCRVHCWTQGGTDMAKKRASEKAVRRRDIVRSGLAAGAGVAVLSGRTPSHSSSASGQNIEWNYEADGVVLGSGCVGLHAAVRARNLGATAIVLEQNFDVGGKLVHSGGWTSLGGGDAIQERDRMGNDPQGLGLKEPMVRAADLEDDPDRPLPVLTHWS